jgi:hypothetical protein
LFVRFRFDVVPAVLASPVPADGRAGGDDDGRRIVREIAAVARRADGDSEGTSVALVDECAVVGIVRIIDSCLSQPLVDGRVVRARQPSQRLSRGIDVAAIVKS